MVAMPMPPPTQSVARPRRRSRRWSSSTRVPRIIAPVAPSGWPIAIAPPLTLVISWLMPRSRMNRIATAANASFISQRSMSPTSRPALASALRAAGAGPVSMIVGSDPETAVITIRARGVLPDRGEARLESGQSLHRRVGTDQLVVVEHGDAVGVLDGDDRVGEVAV